MIRASTHRAQPSPRAKVPEMSLPARSRKQHQDLRPTVPRKTGPLGKQLSLLDRSVFSGIFHN